jgi:hypothetical protein
MGPDGLPGSAEARSLSGGPSIGPEAADALPARLSEAALQVQPLALLPARAAAHCSRSLTLLVPQVQRAQASLAALADRRRRAVAAAMREGEGEGDARPQWEPELVPVPELAPTALPATLSPSGGPSKDPLQSAAQGLSKAAVAARSAAAPSVPVTVPLARRPLAVPAAADAALPDWGWTTAAASICIGGRGGARAGKAEWTLAGATLGGGAGSGQSKRSASQLVTGGAAMVGGRHCWEVCVAGAGGPLAIHVGCVRPGLDHEQSQARQEGAHFVCGPYGTLWGSGHAGTAAPAGRAGGGGFVSGDRIGVLLDLDEGWMRFYRNGAQCGGEFTGVTGPLVRAAQLYRKGDSVTAVARPVRARVPSAGSGGGGGGGGGGAGGGEEAGWRWAASASRCGEGTL